MRNKISKAERRSPYQPDRIRKELNYSDLKPFIQTHFCIGIYLNCRTIKKSGEHSMKLYFSIDSHAPNILCLFKKLPFKYAEEKQTKFANSVETFLQKSAWLKQEWELYEKVIMLHDSGLGRRTIFEKLQLPKEYFYKINHWIHYGQKPLYYTKRACF